MPENEAKTKAMSRLKGEEGDFIEVPESFEVKQGATLLEGVSIGPLLGAGLQVILHWHVKHLTCPTLSEFCERSSPSQHRLAMQGQVYQLNDSDGNSTCWVLKAVASSGESPKQLFSLLSKSVLQDMQSSWLSSCSCRGNGMYYLYL